MLTGTGSRLQFAALLLVQLLDAARKLSAQACVLLTALVVSTLAETTFAEAPLAETTLVETPFVATRTCRHLKSVGG